jgi:hypothetical protein
MPDGVCAANFSVDSDNPPRDFATAGRLASGQIFDNSFYQKPSLLLAYGPF